MHCFVYEATDGSVTIGEPASGAIAIMTGAGGMFPASQIEKHVRGGKDAAVIRPFIEALAYGGLTEDAALNAIAAKDQPSGTTAIHNVPVSILAMDGTFRAAWVWQGSAVAVDMAKARIIHMDAIRVVRNAELVAKDVTFMRAVESGDAAAQSVIATEKQTLRDIPATFDITTGVDTPEKLKAKWPDELPVR
jgi:hypothetical protein